MRTLIKFLFQPPITRRFRHKLQHNFHTLTPGEMIIYFLCIRPFWSKDERFFFEGSLTLLGQMYKAERQALYSAIINFKPRQCFEIGTYTGGGSTFFLGSALAKNGSGTLYTIENSEYYYHKALNYFIKKLPLLQKHISFILADTPSVFDTHLKTYDKVDFVFFDGAEDGQQTLVQYNYFKPYYKTGSVIAFHDWNTEKTHLVRQPILADTNWELITELKPPFSVGMAIFKHR